VIQGGPNLNVQVKNRIILYGFILTVFVIWLHAGESLITSIPGQIAVPGFFILSGFLFFTGFPQGGDPETQRQLTSALMKGKLARRVRTLVVPYLLWNLIYYLIYLAFGETTLDQFFQAVFHYSCNPVFWYLYQLILITILTPFVYWFLKGRIRSAVYLLTVLILAVAYNRLHRLTGVDLLNFDALFYYSVGAVVSLKVVGPKIAEPETAVEETADVKSSDAVQEELPIRPQISRKQRWFALAATLVLFMLSGFLGTVLSPEWINLSIIGQRLFGALALWFMTGLIPEIRIYPWMTITFFIYATHYLVIRIVWTVERLLGLNGSETANIITYLLMPVFCVAAAWGLYLFMQRTMPGLLKLLTGGRGHAARTGSSA